MKQDNPFAKLGALDQQLYQDTTSKHVEIQDAHTNKPRIDEIENKSEKKERLKINQQNASKPENQNAGVPSNQQSSMPALQNSGNLEIQHKMTATEKVTFRFHPEGKYAIEDIKTLLTRKVGIKASYELIAEEAILIAYEDLLENQNASKLAKRLSSKPENKESS
jgi:hypothetical protein